MLELHFNKVTVHYPAISLKERTPTQVFSGEFCEIRKIFTEHLQTTTFVLRRKHCINKIVKNPLRKEKKTETACKKNSHTGKTKTKSLVTLSLQILLLFKNVFVSLFSASCDLLKTQVFRNNAIPLSIIYSEKLFLTFGLKK